MRTKYQSASFSLGGRLHSTTIRGKVDVTAAFPGACSTRLCVLAACYCTYGGTGVLNVPPTAKASLNMPLCTACWKPKPLLLRCHERDRLPLACHRQAVRSWGESSALARRSWTLLWTARKPSRESGWRRALGYDPGAHGSRANRTDSPGVRLRAMRAFLDLRVRDPAGQVPWLRTTQLGSSPRARVYRKQAGALSSARLLSDLIHIY